VTWLHLIVVSATGVAALRAAFEHGDLDAAARHGVLAGPAVVEQALGSPDRVTRLAAIAAAPIVEDRAELLTALARVAGGADRRTAIPAAGAARAIARELAGHDRPDDLAEDDLATWRAAWAALAMRGDRWIELRLLALDTAAALDLTGTLTGSHAGVGVDLAAALRDPDPAFRRAAAMIVALPAAATTYAALAGAIVHDSDPDVALGAAQSLCLSVDPTRTDPEARAILDALGAAGLTRLRALVTSDRPSVPSALRDAARCLAADGSAESAAALRALRPARGAR
jgi:hypothetical protein